MSHEKKVSITVEVARGDWKNIEFSTDHVTGREIKERAGVPLERQLFAIRESRFHLVENHETIHIKNGEQFAAIPHGAIRYVVNDEPQWTEAKELTPTKIMEQAGVDPGKNYLEEIKPHRKSFKDKADEPIRMHDDLVFITQFIGPKPVSSCQ